MKMKKIHILFLSIFAMMFAILSYLFIGFNQRVPYQQENISYEFFMTDKEKQESMDNYQIQLEETEIKDVRVKSDKGKTYIHISLGKRWFNKNEGKIKLGVKILKIKEKENKIIIYAKETGHCVIKNPIKRWIEGVSFGNTNFLWDIYKTISIKKTDKPIEVVWKKHFSC